MLELYTVFQKKGNINRSFDWEKQQTTLINDY